MIKRLSILLLTLAMAASAAEPKAGALCPITGKPANPAITFDYEGVTYAFADEEARKTFQKAREDSIYQQIGGEAAINAAVDIFYVKVLADERVKHFFDDVSMEKQKRKQKSFLSMAFGAPVPYTGKDLRKAHEDLDLNETHFNAIAEHLQATLVELKVPKETIDRIMTVVGTTKDDVLNRPKKS
jgi:hemoglobin